MPFCGPLYSQFNYLNIVKYKHNISMYSIRCSLSSANCSFEEHSNDKEFFMKRKASRFVVVHAICSLSLGDEC
jgi:hypothetical protein